MEQVSLGVLLRLFQTGRLGLAAALGHGFGEVGKQNGDKENDAHNDIINP